LLITKENMERKLEEKDKHIQYLYDELEEKEKDIENLKNSLKKSKNLYQRQTDFAKEAIEEKEHLSIRLEDKELEIADLKMKKCDKGCQKYNKSIDEIVEAATKHKEKLEALKEIASSQKENIFCLRNHRNELFDKIDLLKDEHKNELKKIDKKVAILQEENSNLNMTVSDNQEEIRVLSLKIEQLEASQSGKEKLVSIEDELKQANDDLEKEALVEEMKILKDQVKALEKNKSKRILLLKQLEDLSRMRNNELENLKKTLMQTRMENTRCRYEWKCRRLFCTFDHSYLHRKINKNLTTVKLDRPCETSGKGFACGDIKEHHQSIHGQNVGTIERCYPCAKCGNFFKTNSSLRRHRKHHHKEGNQSMNEFANNVDEASTNVKSTIETGGQFTCLFCDELFKCEREMQIHIEGPHSEKKIGGNSSSDKT
jgi:predicted RNase H-like nuclease (RuvC/YqgF family)